jgi:4-amino-4-deoxy-L-arabinose transferase-like glycosyltransferase
MRLPRWLVVSLLAVSVLAVLGACAWWYVTWPERTFTTFKSKVEAGKFSEANALVTNPDRVVNYARFQGSQWAGVPGNLDTAFIAERPSLTNVVMSERRWRLKTPMDNIVFNVTRSTIRVTTPDGGFHWTFVLVE